MLLSTSTRELIICSQWIALPSVRSFHIGMGNSLRMRVDSDWDSAWKHGPSSIEDRAQTKRGNPNSRVEISVFRTAIAEGPDGDRMAPEIWQGEGGWCGSWKLNEKKKTTCGCYRRLAICTVRLSMYICSVSFPETSLSTSFCVVSTLASITVRKTGSSIMS